MLVIWGMGECSGLEFISNFQQIETIFHRQISIINWLAEG